MDQSRRVKLLQKLAAESSLSNGYGTLPLQAPGWGTTRPIPPTRDSNLLWRDNVGIPRTVQGPGPIRSIRPQVAVPPEPGIWERLKAYFARNDPPRNNAIEAPGAQVPITPGAIASTLGATSGAVAPLTRAGLLADSASLKNWQKARGLKADGIVGPRTRAALNRAEYAGISHQMGSTIAARKQYQRDLGLSPRSGDIDGIVGPRTHAVWQQVYSGHAIPLGDNAKAELAHQRRIRIQERLARIAREADKHKPIGAPEVPVASPVEMVSTPVPTPAPTPAPPVVSTPQGFAVPTSGGQYSIPGKDVAALAAKSDFDAQRSVPYHVIQAARSQQARNVQAKQESTAVAAVPPVH